eukprot:6206127-Pleurochrysis_carterae.AAC.5
MRNPASSLGENTTTAFQQPHSSCQCLVGARCATTASCMRCDVAEAAEPTWVPARKEARSLVRCAGDVGARRFVACMMIRNSSRKHVTTIMMSISCVRCTAYLSAFVALPWSMWNSSFVVCALFALYNVEVKSSRAGAISALVVGLDKLLGLFLRKSDRARCA